MTTSETSGAETEATANVIFGTREVGADLRLALILLNRPAQLNAMNTQMFAAMNRQLDSWEHDDGIVGLGIAGVGERGFCAGGDVVSLRNALLASDEAEVDQCFDEEYFLDSRLHRWTKPVIVSTHGVCMGGGLGLLMAGSHRIVTPNMAIAMPEVNIGFYPDVGSSSFLSQLPEGVGRTLAVTGMIIDSTDAMRFGLATAFVSHTDHLTLWDQLAVLPWTSDTAHNHEIVNDALAELSIGDHGYTSDIEGHLGQFERLGQAGDIVEFGETLNELANTFDFFSASARAFKQVSPTSLVVADRYFALSRGRTPVEVLKTDEVLSKRYVRESDFSAGVRSALVTKDNNPCWQFETVDQVDVLLIDRLLDGL